jgi:hypothetical protein
LPTELLKRVLLKEFEAKEFLKGGSLFLKVKLFSLYAT